MRFLSFVISAGISLVVFTILDEFGVAQEFMHTKVIVFITGLIGTIGLLTNEVDLWLKKHSELQNLVRDFEKLPDCFYPKGLLQKLVDERLTYLANKWHENKEMAFINRSKQHQLIKLPLGTVDMDSLTTMIQDLEDTADHYLKVFLETHDLAKRAYDGERVELQDREIALYVTRDEKKEEVPA